MNPQPAIDLSGKEFLFPKGNASNDLIRRNAQNGSVSGNSFAEVANKVSKSLELGCWPIAFIDKDSKKICTSVAHFRPDNGDHMMVACLNLESSLLEPHFFPLASKQSPPFFIENLNQKELFKGNLAAIKDMKISTRNKDGDSVPGISAIVLPVNLFLALTEVTYPMDPSLFLSKISSYFRDSQVTLTLLGNPRKVSQHVKDLFTFAASACMIEGDDLDSGCTVFTESDKVPSITPDISEKFLRAVESKISFDEDDYENKGEGKEADDFDDSFTRRSFDPSISTPDHGSPDIKKPETPAIDKLAKVLTTALVNQQENQASMLPSSKQFFDKENKEDLKEEFLYFQSLDGVAPATEIDPVTVKFYKNTAAGQASNVNKHSEVIEVSTSIFQSLQFSLKTSKSPRVAPLGVSIFGLTPRKEGGLNAALVSEGVSEAVLKATLSTDQLKSYVISKVDPPKSVFHLMELLKLFKVLLEKIAGPSSYVLMQYSSFLDTLFGLQVEIHRFFEEERDVFIISLLQAINTEIAAFADSCSKGSMSSISFSQITELMRRGTFMNNCRISLPKQSSETPLTNPKKRRPSENVYSNKKKSKIVPVLASSPYPDLTWNEWKQRGNASVRNSNGIKLPVIRNSTICPRFYFEGNCSYQNCIDSRGHFTNLNSAEKKQISDLKEKCISCTQAIMDPVQILFDACNMKSKYTNDSEDDASMMSSEDDFQNPEEDVFQDMMKEVEDLKEENVLRDKEGVPNDVNMEQEKEVIDLIKKILDTPSPTFKKSPFIFENTKKARVHNSQILQGFDYDFKKAMENLDKSVIHPGSEFRESDLLEPLLKNHPDWKILKEIMDCGVNLGFDPSKLRDEETRLKDFDDALRNGNSGTMKDPLSAETVAKNQDKEVKYGRTIPITIECARKLKNGSLTPLGCAVQWTINEFNEKVVKRRTTHNLSYEWLSGLSVNSSVDPENLEEIIYGHCLYRCIHIMHQMRLRFPKVAILMSKFDIDSAFRRLHSWCEHAPFYLSNLPSPDVEDELSAFLDTRMPFGANQGPGKFGIISETATDIANYLMKNRAWTPEKLKSSFSEKIPDKKLLDEVIEFGQAFPLLVEVEDFKTFWDVFVDDLINLTLEGMGLEGKAREAAAIALELLFRPNTEGEEVDRNEILKWEKLLAEGRQEEVKVILGWLINSRIWRIYIPEEKAKRWMIDFDELITKARNKDRIFRQELESILGKANEASTIAKEMRFFLSRLRFRLKVAIEHGSAFLRTEDINDLMLLKSMIHNLQSKGRSLNHISFTMPSLFLKQDASTSVGMGGFNDLGFAWKIVFHEEILQLFHINTLEHLAGVVNIWMAILLLHLKGDGNGMKFLDQSDNMTAIAWMIRTSYFESSDRADSRIREIISRQLANLLGAADIGIHLQHIPGVENVIADILSRHRDDTNNEIHTLLLKEAGGFIEDTGLKIRIVDVPDVIISWIKSIVEDLIRIKALPPKQKKNIRSILENGGVLQPVPDLTFSSITRAEKEEFKYLVRSRTKSEITDLARLHSVDLEAIQSKLPSTMYARPSQRMDFRPHN